MKYILALLVLISSTASAQTRQIHKFTKVGVGFTYQLNSNSVVAPAMVSQSLVNDAGTFLRVFFNQAWYVTVMAADSVVINESGATGSLQSKLNNLLTNVFPSVGGSGGTGAVDAVNGQTGSVSLTQDNIPDGTTNKAYTATEKSKLAGVIDSVAVNVKVAGKLSTSLSKSSKVAFWGDSHTASGYGTVFGTLTGTTTFNGGVNGETSTQIRTRMIADTLKYTWGVVILAGRNDPNSGALTNIATMVAAIPHTRYFVLSIFNLPTETIGTPDYQNIKTLDSTLAVTYGWHYLDARAYLVSQYNPSIPQDVTDHNNDIIPTSLRNSVSDQHLNSTGNTILATWLATRVNALITDSTKTVSGIGITPTARLTLPAGTKTEATAPLKLTSGTKLLVPEPGAVEYDGTHFYGTIGNTRNILDFPVEVVATKTAINRQDSSKRFIDITATADTGFYYYDPPNFRRFSTTPAVLFNSLASGLSNYWKLDETSGNALDATGNRTTASQGNLTQNVTGKIGKAYTFNGTNSQINIPRFMNGNVFSISAWIKTSSATNQIIVTGSAGGAISLRVDAAGTVSLMKLAGITVGTSSGTVANGVFNHVVVTYDAAGVYTFYINGAVSGTGTNVQTFVFSGTNDGIGSNGGGTSFNGQIDEVGIWTRALNATDISFLYAAGAGLTYPFN